ncbi:MAG: sulfoxide reductase heme-binding subunit YedZ [Polyangiaceae bacterium]|nr:sulfoxide reductase heme-binding subunit YedZ [Polyangiaceae bacterium]
MELTQEDVAGVPKKRRTLKPGARPWLQPALVTGAGLPALGISVQGALGKLGANPIAEALNAFGLLALALLVASLGCTPVKMVTGAGWVQPLRRTFGLLGFFYAALHVLLYLAVDQGLALKAIAADVVKRPFITVGMAAFLMLVPLAWTSTQAQMVKLGGARWRKLHKLVYIAVPLGVLHFVLRVKKDLTEPVIFGAIVAVLLGVRAVTAMRKKGAAAG